ncbi:MAG: GNAT family N-acetyltransferase [Bacteroidota bacterium]
MLKAIIRPAKMSDLQQLSHLCMKHAEYEKAEWKTENHELKLKALLFSKGALLKCLVISADDALLGYATFTKQVSTWDGDFYMYLDCIYLEESLRGQGFGKQLMKVIKEEAKKEGCQQLQWQTPNFNVETIQFYKKLGAKPKTKERFFWEIDDLL